MPRYVEKPKNHIVSCRLSDEELQVLQKIAEKKQTNISDLLRQSLGLLDKDNLNNHLLRFMSPLWRRVLRAGGGCPVYLFKMRTGRRSFHVAYA